MPSPCAPGLPSACLRLRHRLHELLEQREQLYGGAAPIRGDGPQAVPLLARQAERFGLGRFPLR